MSRGALLHVLSLLTLLAGLSSACSPRKAAPLDSDDEAGTAFYIDKVTARVQTGSAIPGWGLPSSRLFTFSACATDRRTGDRLRGQRFAIERDTGSPLRVIADNQGCFSWSEDVPLNVFADAKAIEVRRVIRGEGWILGARSIPLALFPWICATCEPTPAIDLRFGRDQVPGQQLVSGSAVRTALAGTDSGGGTGAVRRPLWFNDLVIIGTPVPGAGNGGVLLYQVQFTPRAQVRNLFGATDSFVIPEGRYSVELEVISVIEHQGIERRIRIGRARTESPASHLGGGVVSVPVSTDPEFPIQYRNVLGRLEIAARISPVDGPASLVAFEGLLLPNTGVSTATRLAFAPARTNAAIGGAQRFSFDEHRASVPNATELEGNGLQRNAAFRVRSVAVVPRVTSANALVRRRVSYDVTACLNLGYEDREAPDVDFDVTRPNGQPALCRESAGVSASCKTNVAGCVTFTDEVEHAFYKPQEFIPRKASIRRGRDFVEEIEWQVNPWENSAPGDWRRGGLPPERWLQPNRNQEPSRFVISRASWQNQDSYRYFVDRFLDVRLQKTVALEIPVSVMQNNAFNRGVTDAQPAKPGWYGVRLVLQKEYPEHAVANINRSVREPPPMGETIAAATAVYRFSGGSAFVPVLRIDVPDLGIIRLRANMLVEVALLDESKISAAEIAGEPVSTERYEELVARDAGLEPRTFVGSTIFLGEKDSSPLIATDEIRATACASVACAERDRAARVPFADIVSLRGVNARAVIDRLAAAEHREHERKLADAKLSNVLTVGNLEFAPLRGWDRYLEDDGDLAGHNWFYGAAEPNAGFLAQLNSRPRANTARYPLVTSQMLERLIESGLSSDSSMPGFLRRLCLAHTRGQERRLATVARELTGSSHTREQRCVNLADAADPKRYWSFERKIRALDVNPIPEENEQIFLLNFNAGADFSVGHGVSEDERLDVSTGLGLNLLEFLSFGRLMQRFSARAATSAQGKVEAGYGHSWSWSASRSERIGLGSQTYLGVDIHPMAIELRRYERCVAITPKPELVRQLWSEVATASPDVVGRPADSNEALSRRAAVVADVATRGILLCEGRVIEGPLKIRERYYYFSQQMSDGVMNDTRTRQANPWLFGLRGRNDFRLFVGRLRRQSFCMGEAHASVDHGEGPIEQLARAFREEARVPTMKSFYSEADESDRAHLRLPECAQRVRRWGQVLWRSDD